MLGMKPKPKRAPGRPPKPGGSWQQTAIRFPKEMLDALDRECARRLDNPDRSTLVREAVAAYLSAAKGPTATGSSSR